MNLHHETEAQKGLLKQIEQGLAKLAVQVTKIRDQRSRCQEQLAVIATNREVLKVQQITNDLTQQLANMRGLLEATVATVGASNPDDLLSLENLAVDSESVIDEEEFRAILAGP